MRIAIISTPFVAVPPRAYGGTELVVHELVEGLVDRGQDVTLFATGDSRTRAVLRHLYAEAEWPPGILADIDHVSWAMRCIVEDGGFDVVHAHSAVALACARLVRRPPMVYTIHHECDEKLSAFYRNCHGASFVAISADQRRREVRLPDVAVIHHGLDPERYQWTARPEDYVCFVGRFSRVKGPHTAIDVARLAGVPIRMAGSVHPPDREFAGRELRSRLAQPHVTELGEIGMAEKVPLLRGARALLAPIEWNEPFGLALVEAMLSGCPVVGFPRGSLPELVEDGVTGFIAASVERMVELLRPGGAVDGIDRRRCRERAVERFGRDRMVEAHLRLYERVVAGGPAAAGGDERRVA